MKSFMLLGLGISIIAVVLTVKLWFFGSLVTSGIKSISGKCGTTYGVESIPVISGNWFCSGEK